MRRVLVTGVTGFAGSHLVDYMLELGDVEIWGIQRWRSRTENIELPPMVVRMISVYQVSRYVPASGAATVSVPGVPGVGWKLPAIS